MISSDNGNLKTGGNYSKWYQFRNNWYQFHQTICIAVLIIRTQADTVFFISPSLQWTTSRPTRASHTATAHAFTRFLICRSQPASSTHPTSGKKDSHIRTVSVAAPYSPAVWNRHNANEDVDDTADPGPMSAWKDESDNHDPEIYQ
jgi:hypothetical protein